MPKLLPKSPKGSIERKLVAKKLKKEHRNKWIIKRYREGVINAKLGEKYNISASGAYIIANNAAKNNSEIKLDRKKAIREKRLNSPSMRRNPKNTGPGLQKNRPLTKAQQKAFEKNFEEGLVSKILRFEKKQKKEYRDLQVLRMAERGYTSSQIAKSLGITNGNASLIMHLVLNNNSKSKAKRNSAIQKVNNAVGEKNTPPLVNQKQKKEQRISTTKTKTEIPSTVEDKLKLMQEQMARSKSRQGVYAKTEKRLDAWKPKRKKSSIPKTFKADANEFMHNTKISSKEFSRLLKSFKNYFGRSSNLNPTSVADKLINLRGVEKINLKYTQIFQFASWASYRKWKELKN